jgi:putative addiction module killer protein
MRWLRTLRDTQGKARILMRLQALQLGRWGDVKGIGGGLVELRIDWGPGYRVYLVQAEDLHVVLLCGGTKDTQARDIAKARQLAAHSNWEGS